jgi:antitoxin component of MazEF toxin-antitoxin module
MAMVTITLHEADGTVTMALPEEYAKGLHLKEGSAVDVSFNGQELTARPSGTPYSLKQLLQEHAEILDELDDNSAWVNAPAVGRELI